MERKPVEVGHTARMQVYYIAVESAWFAEFVRAETGKLWYRFNVKTSSGYCGMTLLESEFCDTSNNPEDFIAF